MKARPERADGDIETGWEKNYGDEKDNWAQVGTTGTRCPQDGAEGGTRCPQDGTRYSQDGAEGGTRCPQDGTEDGKRCPQNGAKA